MALNIMYQIACDNNVHKTFVVAYSVSTNSKDIATCNIHRFPTHISCLKELL
jgi:hypothetical protein